MTHKVIIADDSKNIQKVVEIILDERKCEIESCSSEIELFDTLSSSGGDLVFLDFSLSENKDGYDLANIIKSKANIKIIMLFGTFDTVDENKVENNFIENYIFKPFDAEKFLKIYDEVINIESNSKEKTLPGFVEDTKVPVVEDLEKAFPLDNRETEEDWGVDLPSIIDKEPESLNPSYDEDSILGLPEIIEKDLPESLPEQIVEDDLTPQLPNLIEEVSGSVESNDANIALPDILEEEIKEDLPSQLPSFDDLEYPAEIPAGIDTSLVTELSVEDLKVEKLDPKEDERKLENLKKEILEELETDLWDENTRTFLSVPKELGENKKIVEADVSKEVDLKELREELKKDLINEFKEKFFDDLRSELTNNISEITKDLLKEDLVKEVWKVVPEISEKLISKELEEIKNSLD